MKFGTAKEPFVPPGPPPEGAVRLSPIERHEANDADLQEICKIVGLPVNETNKDIVNRILAAANVVAVTRKE
jgi:hypothetical protein